MQEKINDLSSQEADSDVSEAELDEVNGGGFNIGGTVANSGNIVKGGTVGNPGGSNNPSTPTTGGGGFSGPAVKRP